MAGRAAAGCSNGQKDIFRQAEIPLQLIEQPVDQYLEKIDRQGRRVVSLPELVEHFGYILQDHADTSISVSEAFAMFRMRCNNTEVRAAAELALSQIQNILNHPKDTRLWEINITGEEFVGKIWQFDAGKALMKAIGFGEPASQEKDVTGTKPKTSKKKMIGLVAIRGTNHQILPQAVESALKAKRFEIEQEIVALDGAPSVSSSIREIRNHHALADVKMAVETAIVIIKNILDKPQDPKLYRIKRGNPSFHRNVGRLEGGLLLMRAIGFVAMGTESGEMGSVLVLRPLGDKSFDATKDFASSHGKTKMGTSTFKFPSLDPETERFLWRRKADLDIAIRMLDKSYDDKTKKSATKDNTTTSTTGRALSAA